MDWVGLMREKETKGGEAGRLWRWLARPFAVVFSLVSSLNFGEEETGG